PEAMAITGAVPEGKLTGATLTQQVDSPDDSQVNRIPARTWQGRAAKRTPLPAQRRVSIVRRPQSDPGKLGTLPAAERIFQPRRGRGKRLASTRHTTG
ncbi:MAG: hypothetical protein ACKN9U_04935, partial [Pirellulaceae bacterium]